MPETDARILIVDDDKEICNMLTLLMQREGFKTFTANDGESALKSVSSVLPDAMLLDIKMPGMDGTEVIKRLEELAPELPVIIITAYGEIRGAVEAMQAGAHDYLTKPFEHNEVIRVVHRALAEGRLKRKVKSLTSRLKKDSPLRETMGPSDAVGQLISMINRVAPSNFAVIIEGATGSGKELIAHAIHNCSSQSKGSFIPVDCGAIPETLLESELFGHSKGAFTDAHRERTGKIVQADGGTLFLDEISNLPFASQAKLLRVLQESKVYPIGTSKPVKVNIRLLSASNQDLYRLVESGRFRRDLFFRLNEFAIKIPPLRERQEDIIYLAKRFLDITNAELNKNVSGFSDCAIEALLSFSWPGNVREFSSAIRRAVLMADNVITEKELNLKKNPYDLLPIQIIDNKAIPYSSLSLKDIVRQNTMAVEREVLTQALKQTGGNKAKAARMLKIDYKTIHTKVKNLRINTK
ncbi:MAG: sigma-54 dependent transcriptional regulator [Pseudomonadota bacterium]